MPTGKGVYPASATAEEQGKLLDALESIQTDSVIVVPEGTEIGLIETVRAGSGVTTYAELYDRMDKAISKVIVGQTMTTDDGSSKSQAEAHWDVCKEFVCADACLIDDSFNHSVVRWLIDWNFVGAAYPEVGHVLEEAPDLQAHATRDKIIYEMGWQPI